MRTPIPTPPRPHGTAKFTIRFGDGVTAAGYLFTNCIAGYVIPGHASTGGEITIAPTAIGGKRAELFPSGRRDWVPMLRQARAMAGRPAEFTDGSVTVHANADHGTTTASNTFDSPEELWPVLEDTLAAAGWTLVTGRPAAEQPAPVEPGELVSQLRTLAELATAIADTVS